MPHKPSLTAHVKTLRTLGCAVSGLRPVELHHCKGGSMRQFGQLRGVGLKTSDWLQLPLAHRYHQGDHGIERGVESWEALFGSQVEYLEQLCHELGYDVLALAGLR